MLLPQSRGYAIGCVHLSVVCLFARVQNCSKFFFGNVSNGTRIRLLDFGCDPDSCLDPGIFKRILYYCTYKQHCLDRGVYFVSGLVKLLLVTAQIANVHACHLW